MISLYQVADPNGKIIDTISVQKDIKLIFKQQFFYKDIRLMKMSFYCSISF